MLGSQEEDEILNFGVAPSARQSCVGQSQLVLVNHNNLATVMCLLIRSLDLERIWLRTCEALLHVGSLVVPLCFTGGSLVVTWWFLGGLICGSFV